MKRLFKKLAPIIGIAAAIFMPVAIGFIAPYLAGSTILAGAAYGAVTSGVTTALAGGKFKDVVTSAVIGGITGGLAGGGGEYLVNQLGSAFGAAPAAAAAAPGAAAATGAGVVPSNLPAGLGVTPGASAGPSALSFGGSSDVVSAAINTGTGGTVQTLNTANSIASGLNSSGQALTKALTQLAGIAFGAQTTDELNAAQQAYLQQLATEARQNQEVFAQKLAIAQQLRQQGEPDFVKAFGDSQMQLRVKEREAQRALAARGASAEAQAAEARRYATERARRGTLGAEVAGREARAALQTAAGLYPTPPSADRTPAGEAYRMAQLEEAKRQKTIASTMGVAGDFYKSITGSGEQQTQKAGVKPPPGTIVTTSYTPQSTPSYQPMGNLFDDDGLFTNQA